MARNDLIRFRRDSAADWTSANPTLLSGEPGFEEDTGFFKIGDGTSSWNTLPYIGRGPVSTITSSTYTVSVTDTFIIADSSSNDIQLDLPAVASIPEGKIFTIKKTAISNLVTLNPFGSETIDGSSTLVLSSQYDVVRIIAEGEWLII